MCRGLPSPIEDILQSEMGSDPGRSIPNGCAIILALCLITLSFVSNYHSWIDNKFVSLRYSVGTPL